MVKIRTRLFAAFLIVIGGGFYFLVDWILDDVRPWYLQAMEESMVDTATVLASLVENEARAGLIPTDDLRSAFVSAQRKKLAAQIYAVLKTRLNMRVYVTDEKGTVVFDSDNGRDEGKDYSRWNDVYRTLRGQYGARATRLEPNDPLTSTLYVAAPITVDGRIIGVLTVGKPTESVVHLFQAAERKIAIGGVVAACAVVALGLILSLWITRPITQLTQYAKAVRDGKRVAAPRLGRSEIGTLGAAFEEMRRALEGRQYVESYVQTLTHEMKSPLSAIRGAVELLDEDMPAAQRRQFLENVRAESGRIQDLVDRMLQLSALENRKSLRDVEEISLPELLTEIIAGMKPVLSGKQLQIALNDVEPAVIRAERFLIRQAVANLLQNAVDFSAPSGGIAVTVRAQEGQAEIRILDNGPGVPAYALNKVFDRFYSLPRPDTGKKSSGLGLAFVKEAAELHGGRATLENRPEGGAQATLTLPKDPAQPCL